MHYTGPQSEIVCVMPEGQEIKGTYDSIKTIWDLMTVVQKHFGTQKAFCLKRDVEGPGFTEKEMFASLLELGLVPRAKLYVALY